jgi:hypothetical protein
VSGLLTVLVVVALLALVGLALSVRIVQQYERGVLFRLGRVIGVREPGLTLIAPLVEVLRRVSLRIQELGNFLTREQAAGTTLTPASTTPAKAATTPASSPSAGRGAAGNRCGVQHRRQRHARRPSSLRADQAAGCLGRTSGDEGAEAPAPRDGFGGSSRHPSSTTEREGAWPAWTES